MLSILSNCKELILQSLNRKGYYNSYDSEAQSPNYLNKYLQYKKDQKKHLILIVSVGRSGTRWLAEIFNAHDRVKGSCETESYAEFFYRYVKWNRLPVDLSGVFNILAAKVLNDWQEADVSVIASPGLSIDLLDVCKNLEVDEIIWAVNNARFTVTSFYNKGWYKEQVCIQDPNLAIGLQPNFRQELKVPTRTIIPRIKTFYSYKRFFGRIIPRGDFFYTWKELTRVGKIAWYYNMHNLKIYEQLKTIDPNRIWIFRLEQADQNYDYYLKMAKRFNLKPILTRNKFLGIKRRVINPKENLQKEWELKECEEFEIYSKEFQEIYLKLSEEI